MIVANMVDNNKFSENIEENEAVVSKGIEHWSENVTRFAPLDWILERMSNDEREEWKSQYRFGGVRHKK